MNTESQQQGYQFGTFKGVFTPAILTIFGVVMYLRSGWMLGHVGLGMSLLIVTISCAITFITSLSLSALVTNMQTRGGGAYFLLSRSLGLEAGASIGVPLYLAQAVGIAFYVTGFAEALAGAFPALPVKEVAILALLSTTFLAYKSADIALKTQFAVLAIIAISLVSFFTGSAPSASIPDTVPLPTLLPFWVVFAVYFPAATGIDAGVAMSGDLKNPARSIPLGVISAVVLSYVVYLAIPLFLNHFVEDKRVLLLNPLIMKDVARWGWMILAGVWAATLSSAMGSVLAAPRTLQALAHDRILPYWIGKGYGPTNDPRNATIISFFLALICILMGDLNFIAPLLTMFFLSTYGSLCLAAGFETLLGGASWRPTFRVHAVIALFGAGLSFYAMFMINSLAAALSLFAVFGIYGWMKKRQLRKRWGDIRYGILMLLASALIHRLAGKKPDARSWQPNILVLSGTPTTRWYLIELASELARDGCLTVATILSANSWSSETVRNLQNTIRTFMLSRRVDALVKVLPADDLETGATALIKAYGFGPITPNTILLGETENYENFPMFANLIRITHQTGRNLIMLREGLKISEATNNIIHIWWRGLPMNSGLMITLAYLLQRSRPERSIILKTIVEKTEDVAKTRQRLAQFIQTRRLSAAVDVIAAQGRPVFQCIKEASRDAGLIFLGMQAPASGQTDEEYSGYYEHLIHETAGMPPTAFVMAAEDVDFMSIFDA
jgi:solute carrier family 12 (sodium/potassium/chloride transporter), member 2